MYSRMESVVKRVRGSKGSKDGDGRGTIMEEIRETIIGGERPPVRASFVVPKMGSAGAKDALIEMNENILRSEAMYAAEEIIDTILSASSGRRKSTLYGAPFRESRYSLYSPTSPEPLPAPPPVYPPVAPMPPTVDPYQSILMRPAPTEYLEYPYQVPPVEMEYDVEDLVENMDEIVYKMQIVQAQVEALGNTCCLLLEDSDSKEKELRALVGELETLRQEKADKELMSDLLETKADTDEVFSKLSHADFLKAMEELSEGMMKAVHLICRQEMVFQDAIDIILWEVGRKLDRFELQPIKKIININLKKLYKRVKNIEEMKKISLAAATSRFLKTKDICLACNTDALMKECKNVPVPMAPCFMPHTNMKPFLTYKMDRIRKNPLRTKVCNRYCGGSHTVMYRHGHLGRRIFVDYPCPPISEKRPMRQLGSKKTKKPSIDPKSLKDMLWNSVVDRLNTQQESYFDGSKIRDPYKKMKLATKLVAVDPDIASIDSRHIPTYQDSIWQLSEIDPSNPVFIDHLPIKVGKYGVYYPSTISKAPESNRRESVPTPVREPAKTHDPSLPLEIIAQHKSSAPEKPTLDKHSSENLRQSLELKSTLQFKGRSEYKNRVSDLISKRPTFRLPTQDKAATAGEKKYTLLGSRSDARRETIMQFGRKKSGSRTSGQRTSEQRTSAQRTSGQRTSEQRTSAQRTSGQRTSGARISRLSRMSHVSSSSQPPNKGSIKADDAGDSYGSKRPSSIQRDLKSRTLKVDHISESRRSGIKNAGTATVW